MAYNCLFLESPCVPWLAAAFCTAVSSFPTLAVAERVRLGGDDGAGSGLGRAPPGLAEYKGLLGRAGDGKDRQLSFASFDRCLNRKVERD